MPNVLGNSGFDSNLLLSETEHKLGPSPRHLDLDERLFLSGCRWIGFRFRRVGDELYLVYESRKRPGDYDLPAQVGLLFRSHDTLFVEDSRRMRTTYVRPETHGTGAGGGTEVC